MKINYLKINGFGKLEDKEIKLNNNINIIYGKNEAGKSTLLKFITGMFYGISRNKNGKEITDYERFIPWKTEDYSGKIEYELDDGKKYEVFREFSKKNPKIYNENSEDVSKEYNIDKLKGNQFFKEQTNIDEEIFLNTAVIEQQEVKLEKSEQNILIQKISNLVSTGDDNVSLKKAIDKLNKKQVEEVGTNRTSERPLNLVNDKIEQIEKKLENIEETKSEKIQLENEEQEIKKEIEEKELERIILNKIKNKLETENIEEEKIKVNKNVEKEYNEKLEELRKKNKEIKNKSEKQKIDNKNLIIVLIILLINICAVIFMKNIIVKSLIISISVIISAFLIINYFKKRKNAKVNNIEKERELNKIKEQISIIETNKENIIKEIKQKSNEYEKIKEETNKQIQNEYTNKIEMDKIEKLLNKNYQEVQAQKQLIESQISSLNLKIHTINIEKQNIENELNNFALYKENMENLQEEQADILSLNNAIEMAKQGLQEAYEQMKQNITPEFTEKLSKIIETVSNKKYTNIKFSDEEGLTVEIDNGDYVKCEKLSIGTIDQMYFALRLASIEQISNEIMPLILDETFAYYDNERLKNIFNYLNNNNKNQILIFTCTNREIEALKELNINYNLIEM